MKKLFVLFTAIVLSMSIACGNNSVGTQYKKNKKHTNVYSKNTVHGKYLKSNDGRGEYAYRDNSGIWWFYYFNAVNNNYTPTSLPSVGSWVKGTTNEPTEPTLEEEEAEIYTSTVDEVPESESSAEVAQTIENQIENTSTNNIDNNSNEVENQSVEPENTVEPNSEPESSPSESPSDLGSSDFGGGDGGSSD